ncbi:endospore germination permease [Clostridium rectalis]|uniref:endospore germination permease n=1 Tax=Clostridium rectalis TaxID=2040295 RepID=UPI000F633EBE|nr:endospore germination permease [Clostridium rectalis]
MKKLTSKQFVFIIWAVTIVSLKTYPTIFIHDGKRDTWLIVILASIIIFLYFIFTIKVFRKTKCYDLYTIYCKSVGKIAGNILYGFFLFTLFLTLIECSGIESSSMHTNLLLETPIWYLVLFFTIPAIFSVKNGDNSILITTIIGLVLMIIAGINLGILTAKYKNYKYLFPILENGINKSSLTCLLKVLGLYSHITICFVYIKSITNKNKLLKSGIWALLFVIQMEIVSTIGVLTTFQLERAENLIYPKLIQTQLISYWRFLESGEFFVMLQTLGGWYIKYIIIFDILIKSLKSFNIKNKYLIYILTIPVIIITIYIANNLFRFMLYLNIYSYICLINFLIVPFILFVIFFIKHK